VPPYAYSVATGKGFPPMGIPLDASGILSGTPTTPGTYNFGVTATDLAGSMATKKATLIVDPTGITITDFSALEGDMGVTDFSFAISLSAPSTKVVTVVCGTVNGTAKSGSDYVPLPATTLTFNPGETTKNIVVHVNGDQAFEADETFFVKLSKPTNAVISRKQGVGTIFNDDRALKANSSP
jgi:hypothetical protein